MANRNKIAMSSALFDFLIQRSPSSVNRSEVRYIKPRSDEDSLFLAEADVVSTIKLTRSIAAAKIVFNSESYFVVSGMEEIEGLPEYVDEVETTPGLFQVFWFSNRLETISTDAQIREVIDDRFRGKDNFEGFDIEDILILFPSIKSYRLNDSDRALDSYQFLGRLASENYFDFPLELGSAREGFISIFDSLDLTIPYNLILQGMFSFQWGHLYLELYRCVEQLYMSAPIANLKAKIEYSKSPRELARAVEEALSWKPRENEALEAILKSANVNSLNRIIALNNSSIGENPHKSAAKIIYNYRNANVHFRPIFDGVNLEEEGWQDLSVSMLEIIESLYDCHGQNFLSEGGV